MSTTTITQRPPPLDLTGAWAADDGAIYYIRHLSDNTVWWAGLHNSGFHLGAIFSNVFRGVLDPASRIIEGEWADVPRGQIFGSGPIALDVVERDVPRRGPVFELRKRPGLVLGAGGGFGGTTWTTWFPQDDVDIRATYDAVRRSGGPFSDDNAPFKNFAVVFGRIAPNPVALNWALADRSYCTFVNNNGGDCQNPETHQFDTCDGDLTFSIREIEFDPGFWTVGWVDASAHWQEFLPGGPSSAAARILEHFNRHGQGFHCEIAMFGRTNNEADCRATPNVLMPGWMENQGSSVLIDGLPINGNVARTRPIEEIQFKLFSRELEPGAVAVIRTLVAGARVRVTGVINLDEHDTGFPVYAGQPEVHPVYSIDIVQDFSSRLPGADLTGVWHADDSGTYYLRQLDSTVWWLGMSRDQGRAFANVFHGTIAPDGNTISGEWADVPAGRGGARSNGHLILATDGSRQAAVRLRALERTGGFGGSAWQKLHDRPFRGPSGSSI
jgi:hypothetical protein